MSVWARERLGAMLRLVESEESDLILEQCVPRAVEGTCTLFASRGRLRRLFDLKIELAWSATVRVTASTLCEGVLLCETTNVAAPHAASNAASHAASHAVSHAAPNRAHDEECQLTLEARAALTTPVASEEHRRRVLHAAEHGLKHAVREALARFVRELNLKGLKDD